MSKKSSFYAGSEEIYCRRRFRSPFYSTANLNLNCSLEFSSSLSFMFFHRVKEPKRPAPAKSVITAFCSRVASDIPRSAERWSALLWRAKALVVANIARPQWCRKQLFVQASGTKQLAFHAITASRICTAQTNFVLFPILARQFAVILMVPVLFDITIVRELSSYCI